MVRFPGRSLGSLRTLTRELAAQCVFGENVLAQSTFSGRNNTNQFDPEKIKYLKTLVQGRANIGGPEFEAIWAKCLESLKKKCQNLKKKHQQSSKF